MGGVGGCDPRTAPLRGPRALGSPRGSRAGQLPVVAHERGGGMIRKRDPRWQSAAHRAQVAAELMEEAESLTASGIATPAEVRRSKLPPPVRVTFTPEPAPLADPTPSASSAPLPPAAAIPPHLAAREAVAQ